MSRPEYTAPPEIFYNEEESVKYASNTRIITIQTAMSERAIELLLLPPDESLLLLDIGCGSGLSGEVLTEQNHQWVGIDISEYMLKVAIEREVEGDVMLRDMGHGLPFRPGVFDGAISISALQWLCNADKSSHNPRKRLNVFFQSLFQCLSSGAKAIFQFYPENPAQMELVTSSAMRNGFTGGLLVDYPNSSKAKKYFLVLFTGESSFAMPQALGTDVTEETEGHVSYTKERARPEKRAKRSQMKVRDWVAQKKEQQRSKGDKVRLDTKYTARSRGPKL
eukprot:TRINITY_DN2214_c0_g1_i1.p1 TRINITY_DN2214_c0_g1~~TRINITY_DN2214_c0_g1_i1.p1  ORF type:complete len:279 (-),score=50.84 TRINITY_DN2214_c0_g1_i1:108-944(-)